MGREDGYETPQKVCTGILDKVTKKITSLLTDCGEGAACPVYQRWLEDSAAAKAKKQLANKFEAAARKNSQQTKTLSMAEAMAQLDAKLKKDGKNKYGQPCRRRLPGTNDEKTSADSFQEAYAAAARAFADGRKFLANANKIAAELNAEIDAISATLPSQRRRLPAKDDVMLENIMGKKAFADLTALRTAAQVLTVKIQHSIVTQAAAEAGAARAKATTDAATNRRRLYSDSHTPAFRNFVKKHAAELG